MTVLNSFYVRLKENLKGNNRPLLISAMKSVLSQDRISGKLDQNHPGFRIFFGDSSGSSDRSKIFSIAGITEQELAVAIKQMTFIEPSWKILTNPFNILMALIIKYFTLNGTEEEQKIAIIYLAVHFYSSLQFKYFKFHQPNVMSAAVNDLSDKYLLKQEGTMFKTLMAIVLKNHETYRETLKKDDDKLLIQYFVNMRTRINGNLQSLRSHYEETREGGKYINIGKDFHDDSNTVEIATDSGRIVTLADSATEHFVGEATNTTLCTLASEMTSVSKQNLLIAINNIRSAETSAVSEVFRNILELFFDEKKASIQDVKTKSFIGFALTIYQRSNTVDGRVEQIKETLDKWLKRHSEFYGKTNRDATKVNFRKAIYIYLILHLQKSV